MASNLSPLVAFTQDYRNQVDVLNTVGSKLYGEIVKATPVGVGGQLQRSWTFTPASLDNPVSTVGTNSQYLLSVELGRQPGTGISAEGQTSVALWAKRKLRLSDQEATSFAYLLSRKYKAQGRPAQGFLGLAAKGASATSNPNLDSPVPGSILEQGFNDLQAQLSNL